MATISSTDLEWLIHPAWIYQLQNATSFVLAILFWSAYRTIDPTNIPEEEFGSGGLLGPCRGSSWYPVPTHKMPLISRKLWVWLPGDVLRLRPTSVGKAHHESEKNFYDCADWAKIGVRITQEMSPQKNDCILRGLVKKNPCRAAILQCQPT
jgi:hypothetical protein